MARIALTSGYLSPRFAASLAEWGEPTPLERAGGSVLVRPIGGGERHDAMGPYPLFCCRDWSTLRADLDDLAAAGLVSVSVVTDPFGDYEEETLHACFERVVPFKSHFVADVSRPREELVSRNHRKMVRRALRQVEVELCENPSAWLDEWMDVFATLCARHNITSLRSFSRRSFEMQLEVPGTVLFRAVHGGQTVGFDWWFVQGDVAHGHLAAFSPVGYELMASYATKWHVLGHFADRVRWVNLGGAPGAAGDAGDGLTRFKKGWATETRTAYFCGRVLDPMAYEQLAAAAPVRDAGRAYFPVYRAGEFG